MSPWALALEQSQQTLSPLKGDQISVKSKAAGEEGIPFIPAMTVLLYVESFDWTEWKGERQKEKQR